MSFQVQFSIHNLVILIKSCVFVLDTNKLKRFLNLISPHLQWCGVQTSNSTAQICSTTYLGKILLGEGVLKTHNMPRNPDIVENIFSPPRVIKIVKKNDK